MRTLSSTPSVGLPVNRDRAMKKPLGRARRHRSEHCQNAAMKKPGLSVGSRELEECGPGGWGLLHSGTFGGKPSSVASLTANRPIHLCSPAGRHNLCQMTGRVGATQRPTHLPARPGASQKRRGGRALGPHPHLTMSPDADVCRER
ncbi:hypothetical protein AAFF_G00009390 [Aldrovandia affinis]|uniref:Uncharacterized protein n=1 Tax=Aldrovandia affinis TaxID=143900 RepID=A0AAD7WZA3_9TELE|nr:hypothetical protein AAFF_G00009390 [Aldrovandia affinis]